VARIVVPWTREHLECREALEAFHPEYVNVASDDLAYWRLVRDLWVAGEPFTLVEHDVLVTPETLPALDACPERFCSYSVWMGEGSVAAFGCVRFRPVGAWPVEPFEWRRLDVETEYALTRLGWQKHVHYPTLMHLNPGVVELARLVSFLLAT